MKYMIFTLLLASSISLHPMMLLPDNARSELKTLIRQLRCALTSPSYLTGKCEDKALFIESHIGKIEKILKLHAINCPKLTTPLYKWVNQLDQQLTESEMIID